MRWMAKLACHIGQIAFWKIHGRKEPPRCPKISATHQKTDLMIRVAQGRRSCQQRLGKIEDLLPVVMIECRWPVEGFRLIGRENAHPGHKLILSEVTEKGLLRAGGKRTSVNYLAAL